MTIRLTCDVDDTKALLHQILTHTHAGERIMFLTDSGRGEATIQRARVMLSRVRKARRNAGKKLRHFQLHSSIHPHTEDGKRHDMVVVWQIVNQRHSMLETLEDLVGGSSSL